MTICQRIGDVRSHCWALLLVVGFGLCTGGSSTAWGEDRKIEYNRDIRPILSEYCFRCHGPDSASRKADLRLDRREEAVKAGAIAPGNLDESEIAARITSEDPDEMMPPPSSKKTLAADQKEALKRWIAQGAEYQPHWSFIAPKKPALPAVKNESWVRNPIDRFVLAKLEEMGLSPAPEADRRTIARRLALDFTGLPPKPEQVEAFVNDTDGNAYEKYVDSLLASPHWGEHRGRYWLDAARYGDTNGIHFDNFREMWTYRDWLIKAFNTNIPFDQFTIEQLAGDLLPNPTPEQRIASGFNRCNITTNEGGAIDEEYLVLYTRDRTETTSQVWLGLTAGCAVCHDHKFDPLSQKEFYELAAFFNNTTQNAMDGNIKDTPPIIFVPMESDRTSWGLIGGQIAEASKKVEERKQNSRAEFDMWLATLQPESLASAIPQDSLWLLAPLDEGSTSTVKVVVDNMPRNIDLTSGLAWKPGRLSAQALEVKPGVNLELADVGDFERDKGFSYGAWIQIPKPDSGGAVFAKMDEADAHRGWDLWLEGGRVGTHIISRWPEDALKVVSNAPIKPNVWTHVFVSYDGSSKPEGVKIYIDGKPVAATPQSNSLKGTIKTKTPFKLAQRSNSARIDDLVVQDVRLYHRAITEAEAVALAKGSRLKALVSKPADKRSQDEVHELFDYWTSSVDPVYKALAEKLEELKKDEAGIKARGTVAHVMQEKMQEPAAFILFRGDYDKRKDQVKPATPSALPAFPSDLPKNRLGFAKWLLSPDHPLTARVTVNRFWQEMFGTGIVRTTGDFGISGELPSHPELLDWLAIEFREQGWDVKRFYKSIAMSAAYRQSALNTPEKLEKDAANRFLSRGPRFRMDAEMVRDYALAASGLLVPKIGGPSVRPYQPEGVWEAVAMIGSNTRDYKRDTGENLYRRSMYTLWKRAAPPASMEIFNAPNREVCTVRRERTNTPLQALATLNDPQMVEAARHLAELALVLPGDQAGAELKIDFMAKRLLARPLSVDETKVVADSLQALLDYYKGKPEDAKATRRRRRIQTLSPARPKRTGRMDHARQRDVQPG